MDQIKIGKFISKKRKELKLTQEDLASKLCVTNKSVSRWENGKCMPDVSLFNDLCNILDITLEEFLSGEEKSKGSIETINYMKNQKKLYLFKFILTIILFIILLSIILFITTKEYKLDCYNQIDYYKEIYKISDNVRLYSNFEENYFYKYKKQDLKELLESKKININDIKSTLVMVSMANDGGSTYYRTKDKKIYVAFCNSLEGNGDNHNIYISNKIDYNICTYDFDIRLNTSCVETKLNSLIGNNAYEVPILSISDKNIPSYKIVRNNDLAYALIKTFDEDAIKDFKNYFKDINGDYKYKEYMDNYYLFTTLPISLEQLNECIK